MLKDRNEPELAHLVNKKLSPGALLNVKETSLSYF